MPQRRKPASGGPVVRVRFGGFDLDSTQIARIRTLIREHAGATRGDLAMAVCREWIGGAPTARCAYERGEICCPTLSRRVS